jgi:hypothetical protein
VDVEDDIAEHLDESPLGVIGEAGIVAALGERFNGMII